MAVILIGAFLIVAGVVYMAGAAQAWTAQRSGTCNFGSTDAKSRKAGPDA